MSKRTYTAYISTTVVPKTGIIATKTVYRPTEGETAEQRDRRMGDQFAANKGRVKFLGGEVGSHQWSVPSQRHDSSGKPVCHYQVIEVCNALICECDFGQWHPGRTCGHTRQVEKWTERQERDAKRKAVEVTPIVAPRKARIERAEEV